MKKSKEKVREIKRNPPTKETLAFLTIGVVLLLFFFAYRIYRSTILSFSSAPKITASNRSNESIPENIQFLPSQYSLPIEKTFIEDGRWKIADKGASYLSSSARPGETGSIIIYAHNTKNKFGLLQSVKIGDTVSIKMKNGQLRSYMISEKLTVKPTNTSVLDSVGHETLILYTCTGFADTKRLVVKALPL